MRLFTVAMAHNVSRMSSYQTLNTLNNALHRCFIAWVAVDQNIIATDARRATVLRVPYFRIIFIVGFMPEIRRKLILGNIDDCMSNFPGMFTRVLVLTDFLDFVHLLKV